MGEIRRAADGRRLFSAVFKREQIERVVRGEMTLAGLSRELDVSPSVVRRWKRRYEQGALTAVESNDDVVPAVKSRSVCKKGLRKLPQQYGDQAAL